MVFGSGSGDEGAKGMMGTVVYITVFVVVFSVLLGYAAPLLFSGGESAHPSERPTSFDGNSYTMINFFETTNDKYEYQIKSSDYGTFIIPPVTFLGDTGLGWSQTDAAKDLSFDAGEFNVYFYPLSNGEVSEFYFFSHTGWWDAHTSWISQDEVEAKAVNGRAAIPISVGGSFTVYFSFPSAHDAGYYLDQRSGYNVTIGQSFLNATKDSVGFWNVITGLLTFNLPNGGTGIMLIDIAISVAFISCCAFIVFWAATRIF